MCLDAGEMVSVPRAELEALKAELRRLRREVGHGVAHETRSAPTATRTRDPLLRRRFHDIAGRGSMWSDVALTWPSGRLAWLGVARIR